MSYARKRKGYRSITVDGKPYRWRFDTDTHHTIVTLQNGPCSGQQVAVVFTDLGDWWLKCPDPTSELAIITPRHVALLVRLALLQGWTPREHRNQLTLKLNWADFSAGVDKESKAG